jgi:hypothetical protein
MIANPDSGTVTLIEGTARTAALPAVRQEPSTSTEGPPWGVKVEDNSTEELWQAPHDRDQLISCVPWRVSPLRQAHLSTVPEVQRRLGLTWPGEPSLGFERPNSGADIDPLEVPQSAQLDACLPLLGASGATCHNAHREAVGEHGATKTAGKTLFFAVQRDVHDWLASDSEEHGRDDLAEPPGPTARQADTAPFAVLVDRREDGLRGRRESFVVGHGRDHDIESRH